jgi:hypothetical protein
MAITGRKISFNAIRLLVALLLLFITFIWANAQENIIKPTRFDDLKIRTDHPRIWIDATKTAWLKNKCKGKSVEEVQKLAGTSIAGTALTYLITGDEKTGRSAISRALDKQVDPGSNFKDLNTPDGENKRVHIQSSLTEKALCYDWCYPLLSEQEKTEFRNLMVPDMRKRVAFKRGWRSFHNGMYDTGWPVVAGIMALDGDEPYTKEAWDFVKPELEDVLRTFDLVFPDGEWAEGFDYNRHSTYPAMRIFLAIKSATGGDFMASSAHFKNTGAYIIYASKPNGLNLPSDDNDWPYIGTWEHSMLLMLNEEFRDGYNQTFINTCPAERFQLENADKYAGLLWYDPAIKEKPLSDLPLSRIFVGKGLVMARSNWNWDMPAKPANSTWLSFHCGDYMGDHVHFDINSFTISYNGELSIDAGRYDCDWGVEDWTVSRDSSKIGKSQFFNYYRRTIAHNTILLKDPNEKMPLNLLNDGGQIDQLRIKGPRNVPEDYDQGNFPSEEGTGKCDWATNPGRWETGDITSYKATNEFMYVRGDGTKAYSSDKMSSFVRQLFFLQPNLIVIMDRVVSTHPDFKKTWLLHSVNEPAIAKNKTSFELTEGDGRLVCIPVLPHKIQVSKIGGPGNEFLVDTTHFTCGLKSFIDPQELHYGEIPGAWRIEESPSVAAKEDYFLNVIQVSDKNSKDVPEVKVLTDNASEITVQVITVDGKSAVLKFTKGENPTAHLKIVIGKKIQVDEKMPDNVELESGREN